MIYEHEPNMRAIKREWLAARIMAVLGLLLLIAVGVGLLLPSFGASETPPAPQPEATGASSDADDAEARRQEDIVLCDTALSAAQTVGLLPAFATRDGDEARAGVVRGRYVCGAKTDAAQYTIAFDMVCTEMGNEKCVVLDTITMNGGTVIYHRH